jgi:ABC-type uncharacterized transport system fused permease/ATPase subunit
LAGLWEIPRGSITRPTAERDVFYVPQRSYNVIGTLKQQMTYPDMAGAAELSDARLREVLSVLDLQYLLDKPEYLTDESACQRLCVALCVNTRC